MESSADLLVPREPVNFVLDRPQCPPTDRHASIAIPSVPTTKKPCPWANISQIQETVSLADVMSEELARSLQQKEDNIAVEHFPSLTSTAASEMVEPMVVSDPDCHDDFLLAQMLQTQFDREHDEILSREESKFNGASKVSVSFTNYRRLPRTSLPDDDSDEDLEMPRHWDSFEKAEKTSPAIGKSGIVRHGGEITTKHDAAVCGRRNAQRVMAFPPGFMTGDGGGFDMKLSNEVYNKLKVHSKVEERRAHRLRDKKEKSTTELAMDPKTRLILYKLVNSQLLDSISGCISTGKEACVFHAWGGQTDMQIVPSECAIKVFKTTLNEFKNRDQYCAEKLSHQNPRKVVLKWAEKEMLNLKRMRRAGLMCPEVVALKKHVLVMTFIGADQKPALKLKEAKLSLDQQQQAYAQTVEMMKKLFKVCQLVHSDLSEYNLLWHDNQVWVIDVSQSVEPTHPNAFKFLLRDCSNISEYFTRVGVPGVLSPRDLFTEVCGLNMPEEGIELLSMVKNFERNRELLFHGCSENPDGFEAMFSRCESKSSIGVERDSCTPTEDSEVRDGCK